MLGIFRDYLWLIAVLRATHDSELVKWLQVVLRRKFVLV